MANKTQVDRDYPNILLGYNFEKPGGAESMSAEALDEWNPELHPRDEEGKFTEKPGGESLESLKQSYANTETSVSLGGKTVQASPVVDFQENQVRSAAVEELKDRVADPEFSMDYLRGVYQSWFEMNDGQMLTPDTADLWRFAADQTGNETAPDNSSINLATRTVRDEERQDLQDAVDVTRDTLRQIFGETVPVSRGVTGEIAEQLREAKANGETVELNHRTLESWSTFPDHAQQFAEEEGETGAIITAEVPIERVFGASHASPELRAHENEIIVAQDATVEYSPEQIHAPDNSGMESVYQNAAASA